MYESDNRENKGLCLRYKTSYSEQLFPTQIRDWTERRRDYWLSELPPVPSQIHIIEYNIFLPVWQIPSCAAAKATLHLQPPSSTSCISTSQRSGMLGSQGHSLVLQMTVSWSVSSTSHSSSPHGPWVNRWWQDLVGGQYTWPSARQASCWGVRSSGPGSLQPSSTGNTT